MDEDNLQSEATTVENFWRDEEGIGEMADREYFHLQAAERLERQMAAIQRSTRSEFSTLSKTHDYLRMKFRWYYKWHTFSATNAVHYVFLAIFMLAILIEIYLKFR